MVWRGGVSFSRANSSPSCVAWWGSGKVRIQTIKSGVGRLDRFYLLGSEWEELNHRGHRGTQRKAAQRLKARSRGVWCGMPEGMPRYESLRCQATARMRYQAVAI